jgi:hypothetical protein
MAKGSRFFSFAEEFALVLNRQWTTRVLKHLPRPRVTHGSFSFAKEFVPCYIACGERVSCT